MEEIYQALIEEGVLVRNGAVKITRSLSQLKMPATVQAILAARIDRLPAGQKDLLQTVAVIGKNFRLGLVGKVVARSREELEWTLAELQATEFIYEQPADGDIEYRFKHPLTHEAAYNSVLIERRKALHERVAQAIEELAGNNVDNQLSALAHHYGRSSNRTKAVDYLTRGGIRIAQRSASPEAIQHFERALAILREMPTDRSRDSRELELQLAIGLNVYLYQADTSVDAGKAFARAAELAATPEDTPQKVTALILLGNHHAARGELRRASEIAQDLYQLIRGKQNPELESWASHLRGYIALRMGQFRNAEQFFRAAAASSLPAEWRSIALALTGHALWYLGFPEQALALTREGLRSGDETNNPYVYLGMRLWAGMNHILCGEVARAEDLFRSSLNLSTERGFALLTADSLIYTGLSAALHGQAQAGLEQLHRGMEFFALSSATAKLETTEEAYYLALGLELAGRPDEAFATLTPALEWSEQSGAGTELASMHLLKGRLLEGKFHSKEAENSFRTSIEIARNQSAKSPELKATTSLARLLAKQGRRDEARAMLAEIYNWFTEGFDTADLKDAKALLDELNQ
jgi:tetratricopeptide (TPR) repeat protein